MDESRHYIKKGIIHLFTVDWNRSFRYTSGYILCPVNMTANTSTIKKILVTTNRNKIGTFEDALPIMDIEQREFVAELNVCMKPMWNDFHKVSLVVEFMEFYKMLGMNKIIVHKASVTADVEKVLKYYVNEGTMEVLPWTIFYEDDVVSIDSKFVI